MSSKSNRPGRNFSTNEDALITSLGLLANTPAGQHIAKTGSGTLANTADTGGGTGHIIQDEGVSLTQRSKLNFIGSSVIATDNAGNDSTDITITGGSASGAGNAYAWFVS